MATLYEKIKEYNFGFDIIDKTYDMSVYVEFDEFNAKYDDFDKVISRICRLLEVPDDLKLDEIVSVDITGLFKGNEDIQIDGMTMHKSKGLTYDEVIIIGLNKSFPSSKTDIYWYNNLYKNKPIKESIEFAEERRLFYVALTRTKNRVYLLFDKNPNYRSEFIKEIDEIVLGE